MVGEAKTEFEKAHPGVTVNVEYLPVDTRATRFNGAFNDPASAPDVAEFGNTDLAGYTASNGFADLSSRPQGLAGQQGPGARGARNGHSGR